MGDLHYQLRLDAAGIFWVAFCCSWTAILGAGMAFLWHHREMPLVKVRGIRFSFYAIACLHAYWMAVQFAYIVSPFPAQAEYWIMGIYLPFGMALFHASNSRFLYIAREQRKFVVDKMDEKTSRPGTSRLELVRARLDHTQKVTIVIGAGMLVQLLLTVVMYLLSRKFHPSFGLPGTEAQGSPWDVNTAEKTGWEWWPSLVWQFFWSWIVAPVVLWRARGIHDTLGWRTQTVACCLASLPATPMWLVALYVPAMSAVNRYWIAPQWIAISIMFIEIFTIFLPCWQAYKHKALRQETLDLISAWESRYPNRCASLESVRHEFSPRDWATMSEPDKPLRAPSTLRSDGSLFSMGALERLLENNPEPLRQFSALKDFSGENVAFLAAVADWRRSFPYGQEKEALQASFNKALGIYTKFICPRYAEFPINISFQEMDSLESIFSEAARILYGTGGISRATVSQFVPPNWPRPQDGGERASPTSEEVLEMQTTFRRVSYYGRIPESFSATCFDQVEASIKYLVLTNTWPKYLEDSKRSSNISSSVESLDVLKPGRSLGSRVARLLSCEF